MSARQAAVLVAIMATLSACGGESGPERGAAGTTSASAERTTESPLPTPSPTSTTETQGSVVPQVSDAEEAEYVASIKENTDAVGLPDDDTLVNVGYVMCQGYRNEVPNAQVFASLVENFDLEIDQVLEMDTAARDHLCPDVK